MADEKKSLSWGKISIHRGENRNKGNWDECLRGIRVFLDLAEKFELCGSGKEKRVVETNLVLSKVNHIPDQKVSTSAVIHVKLYREMKELWLGSNELGMTSDIIF